MRTRWIVAALIAAVGLVWIGQGLGILRGSSFMVGDDRWAAAGLGMMAIAAVLAWTALRGRRRA
jgi:hypothetical protein